MNYTIVYAIGTVYMQMLQTAVVKANSEKEAKEAFYKKYGDLDILEITKN